MCAENIVSESQPETRVVMVKNKQHFNLIASDYVIDIEYCVKLVNYRFTNYTLIFNNNVLLDKNHLSMF